MQESLSDHYIYVRREHAPGSLEMHGFNCVVAPQKARLCRSIDPTCDSASIDTDDVRRRMRAGQGDRGGAVLTRSGLWGCVPTRHVPTPEALDSSGARALGSQRPFPVDIGRVHFHRVATGGSETETTEASARAHALTFALTFPSPFPFSFYSQFCRCTPFVACQLGCGFISWSPCFDVVERLGRFVTFLRNKELFGYLWTNP